MTTIKSCTNIKQSKKLAEILPLESADMYYMYRHWEIDENTIGNQSDAYIGFNSDFYYGADNGKTYHYIPAWSLAALISIIPQELFDGEYIINITEGLNNKWILTYDHFENRNHSYYSLSIGADNLVDVCYEMILKLHELKIL